MSHCRLSITPALGVEIDDLQPTGRLESHSFTQQVAIELQNLKQVITALEERLNILFVDNINFRHVLDDLCDEQQERLKLPHRCPICNGSTFDEEGAICLPCDGRGIVWG